MFYVVLYFLTAYAAVAIAVAVARRRLVTGLQGGVRSGRIALGRIAIVLVVCLLLPWLPYGVAAAQTTLFWGELRPAVFRSFEACGEMCGDAQDPLLVHRVLWITPWEAEVFLVQPCAGGMLPEGESGTVGEVIFLNRDAHGWAFADYDTAWSDGGSAEGNVFPPDPHGKSF